MQLTLSGFSLEFRFYYQQQNVWRPVPARAFSESGFAWRAGGASYHASWEPAPGGLRYRMGFCAEQPTQLRFCAALQDAAELYPVIPCNILGDNHAAEAKPGEYPLLTADHPEIAFCSPRWEFRADRAAAPFSALCCAAGAAALTIPPYTELAGAAEDGRPVLYNGLLAELPNVFGVSLGYTNDPVTFKNRSVPEPSTRSCARKAETEGMLYLQPGAGRQALHPIVRRVYEQIHRRAAYRGDCRGAARALLDTFTGLNYDPAAGEYTNRDCRPPQNTALRPWRKVTEIGWTGGGVLAYPLMLARELLGPEADAMLARAQSGEQIFDRIAACYNPHSGLLNDLMAPSDATGSRVDGWWTGYGLVHGCHCAYTVGSALHYMLKAMDRLRAQGRTLPAPWLDCCRKVLDTVVALQRADGAFGYTYSATERRVLDWSGFAGCWFAPALLYLHRLTGEERYLAAARRALRYYRGFVERLNCYGTPMDTWKSVDQEGNLAFIRGCRLLHEDTGEQEFLDALKQGADYEFLWRYAYPTRPEFAPLNDGWNACGGSVTSISNPHIHPMGVIVDSDLLYLGRALGDAYYTARAQDSTAWLLQTLELYPEKTGYGQYGVLSERWCPADGLTVERSGSGEPFSSWYSYNLWAAACALEAVCERALGVF